MFYESLGTYLAQLPMVRSQVEERRPRPRKRDVDVTEDLLLAAAIEGYASSTSAAPGDTLDFHVRSVAAASRFTVQVCRRGLADTPVHASSGEAFVPGDQDDASLAVSGCGWPAIDACRIVIPNDWQSGYYVAKVDSGSAHAEIPFFVRSGAPGSTTRVLVKMSDTTAQAYTGWGGRSLYSTPFSPQISFDRPYDDMSLFERYQLPFLQWAEKNGFAFDYCSSLDLHLNAQLLGDYRLLISIGHDEYWSFEMRAQVEAFIASGGNVCFLSANTCYWQARFDFSNGRRIMSCYKETEVGAGHPDPERADPTKITVRWYESPLNRPETKLTGVSYRYGAGWWNDPIVPAARFRGYTVEDASHAVFAQTGLANGDTFGQGSGVDDAILGYETDAVGDATPANFTTLAAADLADWGPGGQAGKATMGIYCRNGVVFTAGTVNWAGGLRLDGTVTPVDRMTRNLISLLGGPAPAQLSIPNGDFEDWQNGSPIGWIADGSGTCSAAATDPSDVADYLRFYNDAADFALAVDATSGDTWISASGFSCRAGALYGAGCWIRADGAGATIRLQTTDTWTDFASAEHSGNGVWEYVFATGAAPGSGDVPSRLKIQVAAGVKAQFENVSVFEIPV